LTALRGACASTSICAHAAGWRTTARLDRRNRVNLRWSIADRPAPSLEAAMTVRHDARVILSRPDYERLAALVASRQASENWPALVDELDRAEVIDADDMPRSVVALGSSVEYRDETTGQTRRVVPVLPGEEDIAAGRISVLTPVGIALIGLSVGDAAEWQTRGGEWKRLCILRVGPPAA
jgi:regulator of nucleoside diphosphate kinase